MGISREFSFWLQFYLLPWLILRRYQKKAFYNLMLQKLSKNAFSHHNVAVFVSWGPFYAFKKRVLKNKKMNNIQSNIQSEKIVDKKW